MFIGYARTSTLEQVAGFEAQVRELQSIGAKKIFKEQVSSVASRSQLETAIDFCREGAHSNGLADMQLVYHSFVYR
jgi:DNA invertase Pin-like site-specific DNA recombinase